MREKMLFAALCIYYNRHYLSKYSIIQYLKRIPYIRKKITESEVSLEKSLETQNKNINHLPQEGLKSKDILEWFDSLEKPSSKKISGVVYYDEEEHYKLLFEVFKKYSLTNPLHPDIFPNIREMEIDIINIARDMFKGPSSVCGNVTSGGTESILLACYTYREWARKEYGITRPNIVAFTSVHPAFDKACHYFGIKLYKVSSLFWMKRYMNHNTICVVASAPTYGYGVVDPINELSSYCAYWNTPLHVDCCMGGFLMPFLNNNPVHFFNKGITSISADTHKYGNTFKGSSILLFRNYKFKQHQHFVKTDWEGGIYATPTLLGSKSGAMIATSWASMLSMGVNGYRKIAVKIQTSLKKIKEAFKNNEDINIMGNPTINIIAFSSKTLDIYKIVSKMGDWNLSIMTNPASFHFCITSLHSEGTITKFISDLKNAITIVKANPNSKLSGTLAVYGSATKIENSIFTYDVVNQYVGLLSSSKRLICK